MPRVIATDVSSEVQMQRAVDAVVERYGRLDVLFANLPGTEGRVVPLVDCARRGRQRINVNVVSGVFLGSNVPFQ